MSVRDKLIKAVQLQAEAMGLNLEARKNLLVTHDEEQVFGIRIEHGKYIQIPEYRITFIQYRADDEWKDTSPLAKSKEYVMPFSLLKRLHILGEDTKRIKDKITYLNWLLSPEKDWFYVVNDVQLNFILSECTENIVRQFIKFKDLDAKIRG